MSEKREEQRAKSKVVSNRFRFSLLLLLPRHKAQGARVVVRTIRKHVVLLGLALAAEEDAELVPIYMLSIGRGEIGT
jgi:hypothetical protein